MTLILASRSPARRQLLTNAGLTFTTEPTGIDESAVKRRFASAGPRSLAKELARAKALGVTNAPAGVIIIGADQILDCAGSRFDKPASRDEARLQLRSLRGRSHTLISAVACARDGRVVWSHEEEVTLHMRDFSDQFLERYLTATGDVVLQSVGAYQIESRGIQLFEEVDGDFFAVLGLPLLPLLGFLRDCGELPR